MDHAPCEADRRGDGGQEHVPLFNIRSQLGLSGAGEAHSTIGHREALAAKARLAHGHQPVGRRAHRHAIDLTNLTWRVDVLRAWFAALGPAGPIG